MDLNPIITGILRLYNNQIKQKRLTVQMVSQNDMTIVLSEPNTLKIILRNIISNAIKFTHEGGSIQIAIYSKDDKSYVRITDNGIGMTDSQIQSLLKSKLSSHVGTNQELGLGIGLKHCISYLKALNAELEISSTLKQGSSFTVKLLRAKP
jgi:signal transduction histidine kinase